jgi:hypothetical protein
MFSNKSTGCSAMTHRTHKETNKDTFSRNPWVRDSGDEARGKKSYYVLRYRTKEGPSPWSDVREIVVPWAETLSDNIQNASGVGRQAFCTWLAGMGRGIYSLHSLLSLFGRLNETII